MPADTKVCPDCGAALDAGATTCPSCGRAMSGGVNAPDPGVGTTVREGGGAARWIAAIVLLVLVALVVWYLIGVA